MKNGIRAYFQSPKLIIIPAVFIISFALIACSSTSEQKSAEPESPAGTGSLSRTFKILDEKGRESGTLTIDPLGGVTLRDENGRVVGRFKPDESAQSQPAATPSETESVETKSEGEKEESKSD